MHAVIYIHKYLHTMYMYMSIHGNDPQCNHINAHTDTRRAQELALAYQIFIYNMCIYIRMYVYVCICMYEAQPS